MLHAILQAEISLSNYTSSPLSHSIIERTHSYSVWAIPHDEVSIRVKKVMEGLRAEFGGPDIEPHIPIVGSIRMTHEDMLNRFTDVQSRFISVFKAKVARVVFRSSYYQCVSLLMESSFTTQNESFEVFNFPTCLYQFELLFSGDMYHFSLVCLDLVDVYCWCIIMTCINFLLSSDNGISSELQPKFLFPQS